MSEKVRSAAAAERMVSVMRSSQSGAGCTWLARDTFYWGSRVFGQSLCLSRWPLAPFLSQMAEIARAGSHPSCTYPTAEEKRWLQCEKCTPNMHPLKVRLSRNEALQQVPKGGNTAECLRPQKQVSASGERCLGLSQMVYSTWLEHSRPWFQSSAPQKRKASEVLEEKVECFKLL